MDIQEIIAVALKELIAAYKKHGREQWGRHEFYSILKEEIDEVWDEIKTDGSQKKLTNEIAQVIAVCFRYLETGDKYRQKSEGKAETKVIYEIRQWKRRLIRAEKTGQEGMAGLARSRLKELRSQHRRKKSNS